MVIRPIETVIATAIVGVTTAVAMPYGVDLYDRAEEALFGGGLAAETRMFGSHLERHEPVFPSTLTCITDPCTAVVESDFALSGLYTYVIEPGPMGAMQLRGEHDGHTVIYVPGKGVTDIGDSGIPTEDDLEDLFK